MTLTESGSRAQVRGTGESATADLLVLGSRAQGTVSRVLFGGVTMACAQHAVSDVLLVHAPDVPEELDSGGTGPAGR